MVSLPSFLRMTTVPYVEEVQRLKTMKGQLGSYLRGAFLVCKTCGELPCPPEAIGTPKSTKWGEVLYMNALVIAMASKNLELLTNELREAQGKQPLDYSSSVASTILEDQHKIFQETAEEMGYAMSADGRLVRS